MVSGVGRPDKKTTALLQHISSGWYHLRIGRVSGIFLYVYTHTFFFFVKMERGITQGTGSRQVYKADSISDQQVILKSSAQTNQLSSQYGELRPCYYTVK